MKKDVKKLAVLFQLNRKRFFCIQNCVLNVKDSSDVCVTSDPTRSMGQFYQKLCDQFNRERNKFTAQQY